MRLKIATKLTQIAVFTIIGWQIIFPVRASIPLDRDIPEEILRAEIITEARSPIDGKALSAQEFAELVVTTRQQLELDNASIVTNNSKVKETILLLRLRGFLRSIGIPIKWGTFSFRTAAMASGLKSPQRNNPIINYQLILIPNLLKILDN